MFFLGCGAPPSEVWPVKPFTVVGKTPVIREKPFLSINASGEYGVFVPAIQPDTMGCSWATGPSAGEFIPINQFHIAQAAEDTAASLNSALSQGLNLLLTPGIYHLEDTIRVSRAGTVVLGIGMPTLRTSSTEMAMAVGDENGITIAGIIFDAGQQTSRALIVVGQPGCTKDHSQNPIFLFDIFCRVGGASVGSAKYSMIINSSHVIGDHFWLWRADHGTGVNWESNTGENGLIVNGRDVTIYGLFVEHYQEDQVLWNADGGRVYFFQSEMPYDPPNNDVWKHGTFKGWPAYKVADKVCVHEAWGFGVYSAFRNDNIFSDRAIEVPGDKPNIKFHNALTFRLSSKGTGGISNVINEVGGAACPKAIVQEYPK